MINDKPVERLVNCTIDPLMGGVSIHTLAHLHTHRDDPAMNLVCAPCSQGCGTWLEGPYFFAAITACDACRAKADQAERVERSKVYWEAICPPSFRETKKDHPGFPTEQHLATQHWDGGESLFFKGPTGRGKTRLAIWLLRRCLWAFSQHVGIMWPEQLKAVRNERALLEWIGKWGRYDTLLLDDALMTAASDSRCAEALKDLVDYRQRYKRQNIVTSQIGEEDVAEQMDKFGKSTKADKEMVRALCRRLRETSRVIAFDQPATLPPRQRELAEENVF